MSRPSPVLALLLAAVPIAARADSTTSAPRSAEVRIARRSAEVTIDGRITDPAWEAAPLIGGFLQRDPNEGAPARQRTEVRVLYDDDALYVGARLYDTQRRLDRHAADAARRAARAPTSSRSTSTPTTTGAAATTSASTPRARCTTARSTTTAGSDNSWDGVWEGRRQGRRRGLDRRDADPVLAAPLRQGRAAAAGASTSIARWGAASRTTTWCYQPKNGERLRLALPDAGRAREREPRRRHRDRALRHVEGGVPAATRRAIRSTTARSWSPNVRRRPAHGARQQAHAERHGQPRLRPGRGRPGGREPERRRDVLPREAAVLRRGQLDLRRRPAGRERLLGLQLAAADVLLLAPHRPTRRRAACPTTRLTPTCPTAPPSSAPPR